MYLKYKQKLIVGVSLLIVCVLIISGTYVYFEFFEEEEPPEISEPVEHKINDTINPLANQAVFLEINRIRKKGIEEVMRKRGKSWKEKPIYHYVAILNTSGVWKSKNINKWDTGYIGWEAFRDVQDEQESCEIEFNIIETKKKLFGTEEKDVEGFKITYDFKTGRWSGDDFFNDNDGYGHYDGDNYEIWFDVHQSDYDGDCIPYWTEVNILHTDPEVDDSYQDPDEDGVPTAWEWKWGYDPFVYDNHSTIDPEIDGLSNYIEYKLEKWLAHPYQKDIYLEADFMKKGGGRFEIEHVFWEESQQMLIDEFNEQGISVHIDDGCMGGGGEYLRYVEGIGQATGVASEFYKYHFSDERKGVFHYLFVGNWAGRYHPQDCKLRYDVMGIPSNREYYRTIFSPPAITPRLKRIAMAVGVMHELGHSLGLMPTDTEGNDNATIVGRNDLPPLQKLRASRDAKAYWDSYESCMNYGKFGNYVLGYSDGSHGERDFDDWSDIDLTYFQRPSPDTIEGIE